MATLPEFKIDDVPVDIDALSALNHENPEESTMDTDQDQNLDEFLRAHGLCLVNQGRTKFWPRQLVWDLLTRERVEREMLSLGIANHLDFVRPTHIPSAVSPKKTYLVIFAILVLIDKASLISEFVEEELSDDDLPLLMLDKGDGKVRLRRRNDRDHELKCLRSWRSSALDSFVTKQRLFTVHRFELDPDNNAQHYKLDEDTVLPWTQEHNTSNSFRGGYADVRIVKIDRHYHNFDKVLDGLGIPSEKFALKILHRNGINNDARFRNELDQLKRFGGLVHENLITLLATFEISLQYHFLFPKANHTLEDYWECESPTSLDKDFVRWVARQCAGITGAISIIHDPTHLQGEKRYGRHGDIKPDNILCFSTSKDPRGLLVIADMGLSSFNRDTSRSNIPNEKIPRVPGYRPPECDVKDAKVSRAFDIWTLGCLFMELMTWCLGGERLRTEFEDNRQTIYITGAANNIFFDVLKHKDKVLYAAQVKPAVSEWFSKLHNHPNCTGFVRDVLDIIEKTMLVVLSKDRVRATSKELDIKFSAIHSKALQDEVYCTQPLHQARQALSTPEVRLELNPIAQRTIKERKPALSEFVGQPEEPLAGTEMESMDIS